MNFGIEILDEMMGFMKSRIVMTAAELDVFTLIENEPVFASTLSERIKTNRRATERILDCLVGFGLLEKNEKKYSLTEKGGLLSASHPETVLPMVLHANNMWSNWSELTSTVKAGTNPNLKPVLGAPDFNTTKAFIGAMHVVGRKMSKDIADCLDLSRYSRLLDIGGASGTYTIAFLENNPQMKAIIFDLEPVIPLSREAIEKSDVADRVEFVAGDFYNDELPSGCDVALLSAIIHQNSREENMMLFKKIYRCLEKPGILLIRDHVMADNRTEPLAGALFAINMLVHTPGGDTYTFAEIEGMLIEAGFGDVKLVRKGERMDGVVEAKKKLAA